MTIGDGMTHGMAGDILTGVLDGDGMIRGIGDGTIRGIAMVTDGGGLIIPIIIITHGIMVDGHITDGQDL